MAASGGTRDGLRKAVIRQRDGRSPDGAGDPVDVGRF
jgi:hypothetical protein